MPIDSDARHRRSLRLAGYDYSSEGAYFVTIVTWQRSFLFKEPELAAILQEEWSALAKRFPTVELDEFIVMPNHVHLIIWLTGVAVGVPLAGTPTAPRTPTNHTVPAEAISTDGRGAGAGASPAPTLGEIIGAFKSRVVVRWLAWISEHDPARDGRVWQRNYHERIIRNEDELNRIRQYILDNPVNWHQDPENPAAVPVPC